MDPLILHLGMKNNLWEDSYWFNYIFMHTKAIYQLYYMTKQVSSYKQREVDVCMCVLSGTMASLTINRRKMTLYTEILVLFEEGVS